MRRQVTSLADRCQRRDRKYKPTASRTDALPAGQDQPVNRGRARQGCDTPSLSISGRWPHHVRVHAQITGVRYLLGQTA